MTFLPIVERELRIASRLGATYRNRTLAAGVVMVVAFVMHTFGVFVPSRSEAGIYMFRTLAFLAMLFCTFEGVRKTADCLSEEKREGTLGLLFLTDLKGYDVVLGKFVGASLNSVYGLLAILPVLAIPLLIGGVMMEEYWRMVLALTNILFFSLCLGMLVSAVCRQEGVALGSAFFTVVIFVLLPVFFPHNPLASVSPACAYTNAFGAPYLLDPQSYWRSLGITQALSWLMLFSASLMLPYRWQDSPAGKTRLALPNLSRSTGRDSRRERARREMLAANPALWLAARHSGARGFLWLLIAVIAIGGLLFIPGSHIISLLVFFAFINFILKVRVAYQASHCLAEARRNNALEMLLATPLTVNEIIQGQVLALQRIFLGPIVYIIVIEFLEVFGGMAAANGSNSAAAMVIICTVYFTLFGLDIVAVTWVGMWYGLTSKKESQAVTKTVLLVLVLPYAAFIPFCWFGVVLFIGVPIFWMSWCGTKLRAEFRDRAAQRYTPPSSGLRWPHRDDLTPKPPVIVYPTQ
jgi:hypothetical protein